jgi:hypothetical protein
LKNRSKESISSVVTSTSTSASTSVSTDVFVGDSAVDETFIGKIKCFLRKYVCERFLHANEQ